MFSTSHKDLRFASYCSRLLSESTGLDGVHDASNYHIDLEAIGHTR